MGKFWRDFWKRPDAAMLLAGGEGERQVALVRVVVVALLLITPVWRLIENPSNPENIWGFVVTVLAMIFGLAVLAYLRYRSYQPWLGFLTSIFDGSLVTLALTLFVIVGNPLDGVNDKITYEVYFLVLAAMSLRQDRRICILVGGFVVLQYGTLVGYVATHYDVEALYRQSSYNGAFSGADQWTRVILMASAVFISYAYVVRSQRLVNRAIRDPMTGLLNRGYFDTLFGYEIERARRYQQRFAVVVVDADHFKQINDSHGHAAGDAVLKVLARTLQDNLRESDVVVRFGGEEFVLLLHDTGADAAFAKAEAMRLAVARLMVGPPEHPISFTLSAGVAVYPDDGTLAHVLLSRADQRLLQAKHGGRNRVVGRSPAPDTEAASA
ncbi:MAG TPA: GGDEF domain-containing protein [Gammaproteobacteria bacterium]|jgi:diguanylate cyclase (GGDEF)-like protein|nr:GGDEF domain-containing protein [Gammaproteobacteria bacterium]